MERNVYVNWYFLMRAFIMENPNNDKIVVLVKKKRGEIKRSCDIKKN